MNGKDNHETAQCSILPLPEDKTEKYKFHTDRTPCNYIYPMGVNYGFMIQIVLK